MVVIARPGTDANDKRGAAAVGGFVTSPRPGGRIILEVFDKSRSL